MFRRPMLFAGLALALAGLGQPLNYPAANAPSGAPKTRTRRSGKGRPNATGSRPSAARAARFTSSGKRARMRRRSRHLQGRG